MHRNLLALLTFTMVPLVACNLYFDGGDEVDPCEFGGGTSGGGAPELIELRNPTSGQCESFFGPGGTEPPGCDDTCGPCDFSLPGSGEVSPTTTGQPTPPPENGQTDLADEAQLALPTWGNCESFCTGLAEDSCLATSGCRGIYTQLGFQECWQTDFDTPPDSTQPICGELGAEACSRFDVCSAQHASSCDVPEEGGTEDPDFACQTTEFISCFQETETADGCFDDGECGSGYSCNAEEACLQPPAGDPCPEEKCGTLVPQPCYGYCVPDYDPGECDGDLFCDQIAPTCPTDTTPGIFNGCWSGYCIPLSVCPTPSCSEIQTEATCVARTDCDAFYQGVNCDCTPEGCECTEWQFDRCSS